MSRSKIGCELVWVVRALILKFRVQFSILLNVLKVNPKFDFLINALPQELCDTRRVFRVWHLHIISCVYAFLRAKMKRWLRHIGCLPVIWERWAMHCSSRIRLMMTVFSARSVTSGRGVPLRSSDDQPNELQHGRRVYIQASLLNLIFGEVKAQQSLDRPWGFQ